MNRVLTAALLLAIFLPAIFLAPLDVWAFLLAVVAALAAQEWAGISDFTPLAGRVYAVSIGLVAVVAHMLPQAQLVSLILFGMAALFWVLIAPVWLARRWSRGSHFVRAMTGFVVIVPTWAAMVALRERGALFLLGLMALVWIADVAAYYAGRRFGRHKLAPAISPGKSWEGVAGAGLALLLYASAVSAAIHGLRAPAALTLAAALLYFSILGDLFESWMKRQAGVKDSGTLLPGHGGVLDRIDALTSALPIAAGVLYFWSGA